MGIHLHSRSESHHLCVRAEPHKIDGCCQLTKRVQWLGIGRGRRGHDGGQIVHVHNARVGSMKCDLPNSTKGWLTHRQWTGLSGCMQHTWHARNHDRRSSASPHDAASPMSKRHHSLKNYYVDWNWRQRWPNLPGQRWYSGQRAQTQNRRIFRRLWRCANGPLSASEWGEDVRMAMEWDSDHLEMENEYIRHIGQTGNQCPVGRKTDQSCSERVHHWKGKRCRKKRDQQIPTNWLFNGGYFATY